MPVGSGRTPSDAPHRRQARWPAATKKARFQRGSTLRLVIVAPKFKPFDLRKKFKSAHRNLPHWQQPGATYFVTFRLADSLPKSIREQFAEMRQLNTSESFSWIDRYLDAGSGNCIFNIPANAATVASTLQHFDEKQYSLGAFVVMPNHVHALVQPIEPNSLTSILHSWKSFTAHKLQRQVGIDGRVWQEESFDRIVRDPVELKITTEYILANPAAAGLHSGTYTIGHGSARWLESSAYLQ